MKNKLLILLLPAVLAAGCHLNNPGEQEKKITINLREAWFPWAGYAGELIAQHEVDSAYHVDFTVDAGAEDIDPVKMVLGGKNDFGIASAENILLSNQKGAGLVAIGALNYKSSTCFITLPSAHIGTVKDFEGKVVGILTGSETETVYNLLVQKNHLDISKIKTVEAPYDLKSFITTKNYDVRPAFIYDEPVSLDAQGIKYNIIKPEDYGVQIMGAVYFTTRDMVSNHPEKVQAFVNVVAKGWERALADPAHGIKLLKDLDHNINEKRELACLKNGSPYFAGEDGKALYVKDAAWSSLAADLVCLKKLPAGFDVSKSFDNSFVKKYHGIK